MPHRPPEPREHREARRAEFLAIRAQIGKDKIIEILGCSPQSAKIWATRSLERVITKEKLQKLRDYLATRKTEVA